MPSMCVGCGMPATSRIVGPTSITCVNCVRSPPCSAIRSASGRPSGCACRRGARRPACPTGTGSCRPTPRPRSSAAPSCSVPHASRPPHLSTSWSCCSSVSGIPFSIVSSLNVPVERALHAGAVVAPDVDHERVLELAHLLDRVEHAADVPVGVLASSPRRPPSGARSRRRWFSSSESQAGIASGRGVSSASAGITPSCFWRSNVSSRSCPSPGRTRPCTCPPTRLRTWCGAWLQPVEK